MAASILNSGEDKTFGIRGIPPPPNAYLKTKEIPYAPGMPLRREITALANSKDDFDKKQWTLFVLALERFKARPVNEKLSYFQVAGIHGYPETSWDGADAPKTEPTGKIEPGQDPSGGYCAHNTVTFPTWHRPYMLLFEKSMWHHMIEQIDDWVNTGELDQSETGKWREAANTWRLPYWDWALRQGYNGEFSLPKVFTSPIVSINPPSGGDDEYENPLWGFSNPEKSADGKPLPFGQMPEGKTRWNIKDDGSLPWSKCTGVSRYGVFSQDGGKSYEGLSGVNNFQSVNFNLNNYTDKNYLYNPYDEKKDPEHHKDWKSPGTLADAVSRMFSPEYNDTWGTFATTKWWGEGANKISTGYMSLEYIHNNVHNLCGGTTLEGGTGHMADVPVAAFDPLFWLHHCNIDRLLAMWQVLNWNAWWDKKEPVKSKFPDPTPNTPLEPFHTTDGGNPVSYKNFWTSEMARDWTKLCYQYDTLEPGASAINPDDGTLNEEVYKEHLWAYIVKTYPSTSAYVERILARKSEDENKTFFGENNASNGEWNDYIINIEYDRYALKGNSYTIEFWLGGEPNERATTMHYPENRIGQVYVLGGLSPRSAGSPSGCPNCAAQRDGEVLSKAQVPLTIPLMSQAMNNQYQYIHVSGENEVIGYLKNHLHWRFVQIGGIVRPASEFPKTKISIWVGKGRFLHDAIAQSTPMPTPPKYGNYKPVSEVTDGKTCGLADNDEILGKEHKVEWKFRELPETSNE